MCLFCSSCASCADVDKLSIDVVDVVDVVDADISIYKDAATQTESQRSRSSYMDIIKEPVHKTLFIMRSDGVVYGPRTGFFLNTQLLQRSKSTIGPRKQ